jgi:glyoxylase-like metal-dependent hydrolase (beta-lactamase superfamily II)
MVDASPPCPPLPAGVRVFERGWLSSNNVLLQAPAGDAVLVDTGHTLHAAQTLALVAQALGAAPLERIVNTHLHSDHCGGNAALQRRHGCLLSVPSGHFEAARAWDADTLSYAHTGQVCERYTPDEAIAPGSLLQAGGRTWQALAAPGHDPHSLLFFDAQDGWLISADALWEQGFGVVFPELDGERAFEAVGDTLALIERLAPAGVIPGHGRPFGDVAGALARARQRLAGFVAEPARHARHGARVLVKYHLMEARRQDWPAFEAWCRTTPLLRQVWLRLGAPGEGLVAWGRQTALELAAGGALVCDAEGVADAA